MQKRIDRKSRKIWGLFLVLVAIGLGLLVWWRVSLPTDTSNLLTNPGFDEDGLSGWQTRTMGAARTAVIPAPKDAANSMLTLEIADTDAGSLAGIGQRLNITPLERYRLATNYGLLQPEQSSARIVVRVSQFDKNGQTVRTDEFSSPNPLTRVLTDDTGQLTWRNPTYNVVTAWRAETVEIGLGLFGQQATSVAVDDFQLQRHPTWLSQIVHDPIALPATGLVIIICGYLAGWPLGRRVYKYIELRQRTVSIWQEIGWMALIYTGLTLLLTYPVGWQLTTGVPGAHNWDNLPHVWYQWWGKEAILDVGVWLDQLTHNFYPLGLKHSMLALHPYVPFSSLPFTLLRGALFSYNVAFLLSFILSGLTGYLLGRYLTRNIAAALVGGLIFAFYPNRVGHAVAGHILWMTNYFLPLYALSLLILLDRPSTKRAIWYGIVTALLALANPMDLIHGLLPILAIIGGSKLWAQFRRPANSSGQLKHTVGWLVAANIVALLFYLPFAWSALTQNKSFLGVEDDAIHSANLLAFVLPSPYQPWLNETQQAVTTTLLGIDDLAGLGDTIVYLGLIPLVLTILAVVKRWGTARTWLGLTLVCAILSMGPYLEIGNQPRSIPLPYLWLAELPVFEWSRTPVRFSSTVMLGIAVLAAIGLAWLVEPKGQRAPQARQRGLSLAGYLTLVAVSAVILVEYLVVWPFPTEEIPVSDYYYTLASEPIDGGILEIPPRRVERYALYYQTLHEHPLANGGEVSRFPAGAAEFRRFQHQFLWPWPAQTVFPALGQIQIRAILADMNIKRVIAHRADMTGGSGEATLAYLPALFGAPIFEDDQILAYAVSGETKTQLPAWQIIPD